jgi:uridine kinase
VARRTFSELAMTLRSRRCTHRVRLVAVDGGAGAGKTTFAGRLSQALDGAPIVKMDDFISFDDLEEWWLRLERQVLEPLFAGKAARYQIRDWVGDLHGRGLGDWVDLPFSEIVIFEGVGSSRRALGDRLCYSVWIEAPAELRIERGVERDRNVEGNREIWLRWLPGEQRFHDEDGTRQRADLIVDGTVPYDDRGAFEVLAGADL